MHADIHMYTNRSRTKPSIYAVNSHQVSLYLLHALRCHQIRPPTVHLAYPPSTASSRGQHKTDAYLHLAVTDACSPSPNTSPELDRVTVSIYETLGITSECGLTLDVAFPPLRRLFYANMLSKNQNTYKRHAPPQTHESQPSR